MRRLQVITLGCSKNTVDTEHLLYQVQDRYELVPEGEDGPVDVLLINTCGFIGDAKEESVNTILAAAKRKAEGQVGRLLVFGCLSQRYPEELPGLIPEVDGWFGARELEPLVRALGCEPGPSEGRYLSGPFKPYAYLKISEGCDRRCSYCAIPFIRGAHKSVPMEQLVEEARSLALAGVKELIIIAQDTTYYGLDLYGKRCLSELLQRLSQVEGIEWLRIHYSYPASFPEDVFWTRWPPIPSCAVTWTSRCSMCPMRCWTRCTAGWTAPGRASSSAACGRKCPAWPSAPPSSWDIPERPRPISANWWTL